MLLPHVTPAMLHADYWLERAPDPDAVRLNPATSQRLNAQSTTSTGLPDILTLPDTLSAAEVRAMLRREPPASARYAVDGSPIPAETWAAVLTNSAFATIPDSTPVQFALATRRTSIRALPTALLATREPGDLFFDRLQETTIDVGWPLAILHTSADTAWVFAITPDYAGWLRADHVARTDRNTLRKFTQAAAFLLAVQPWSDVACQHDPQSGLTIQLGTRLPLTDAQSSTGSQQVMLPGGVNGQLNERVGFVAADDPGWAAGYQPATMRTVLTTAFRVLGEPYTWGGQRLGRSGRDCSRLVRDVYATLGVYLPRNSGQQARVGPTAATFAPGEDNASRIQKLATIPAGALLFLPGHVMLHLGVVDGIPYALHDLWGYARPEGDKIVVGAVVVSALPPEPSAQGDHTLLERLTHVQTIFET
ncbi:SH3 domain-containing protein [Chloroflexota bacterium]